MSHHHPTTHSELKFVTQLSEALMKDDVMGKATLASKHTPLSVFSASLSHTFLHLLLFVATLAGFLSVYDQACATGAISKARLGQLKDAVRDNVLRSPRHHTGCALCGSP